MPAVSASAPGKIILFGEHAVVYNRAAIAIPVHQLKARAYVLANPTDPAGESQLIAPDVNLVAQLNDLPEKHPFRYLIRLVLEHFRVNKLPAATIKIKSDIPIASGLGSGTAVSVALIRALASFVGQSISNADISSIAFEVEKLYHGRPSGIDNSVITYETPIFFIREKSLEPMRVHEEMLFIIADSGVQSKTSDVVSAVNTQWQENERKFNHIFDEIDQISHQARDYIESGPAQEIGRLMNRNHQLLNMLQVSSPILDKLVSAAIHSGAYGAKLSGAGRGGNMIAYVSPQNAHKVEQALIQSGATRVLQTHLTPLRSENI